LTNYYKYEIKSQPSGQFVIDQKNSFTDQSQTTNCGLIYA